MNTLKECFDTILRNNEKNSRLAARSVSKFVYGSAASSKDKYEDIANLVRIAPENYSRISEDWRQENYVMAVSVIYFLHDRENQPDFLFPWLFQLLQHPNGHIRYAAVKMIRHEIGPLTYHLRFPGEASSFHEITPGDADIILRSLLASLNGLLTALWQPKYKRHKYVDSLPAGPYKSAQMVLAELKESCGKKYIDRLADYFNG
ncbi:MAG: hypothetical protein A3H76_04785 [Candidatus Lloydbacteria bacterium RIFCSPLOWO2_02_FULL_54_12]|nr:MAG: hypothetical protein A3H76_04785 [Candidatus Lloydbacteria bacterium RIFCSPLOWO2_02_FULL_54_12]